MDQKPAPHPLQSLSQCRPQLTEGGTYYICKKGKKYLSLKGDRIRWSGLQGDATVFDDREHLTGWLEVASMDDLNAQALGTGRIDGITLTIRTKIPA